MAQTCVHQSCGKKFTDPEEDCTYHPGPPIFHEGQKGSFPLEQLHLSHLEYALTRIGWKCCKPRVLTFDEFLSIPPCTTGKHSTTDRPPALEKTQPDPSSAAMLSASSTPEVSAAPSRAPISAPQPVSTPPPISLDSDSDDPSLPIPDGRICRRRACGQQYKSSEYRKDEKCVYHPGAPLFHEGSKGYTCCKRRVLEFDEFMKIEGCQTKGKHLFVGSGKRKGAGEGGGKYSSGEEMLETAR